MPPPRARGILAPVMHPPNTASPHLLRLAFYALAVGMALVHVFVTFQGLRSAQGMEQAQLARELARGHGFQTLVVRPQDWARLIGHGVEAAPQAMPDLSQPPVQPLLLAPVFKLLEKWQAYRPLKTGPIYLLDRAIACVGVTAWLLTLLWTHGAARRLFDEKIAAISVLALMLCQPLWELAVSGSPAALLLPMAALALRLHTHAATAAADEERAWPALLGLGLLAALMALTHWMALWLVLGLGLGVALTFPARRAAAALLVLAPPLLALAGWAFWMFQRCGDPLGGAKSLLLAHLLTLDPELLPRSFSLTAPPVDLAALLRKAGENTVLISGEIFTHLGRCLPALFFVAALLHRFKNPAAASVRGSLGITVLAVLTGSALLGLPGGLEDDRNLLPVLVPALTVFGTAMLAVLWARLFPQVTAAAGLWQRLGFAVLAVGVTALPLLTTLPPQLKLGLTLRARMFPHWPPYAPDRVQIVSRLLEPGEVVFADAPWFVAWYADVPALWIPARREEYPAMKAKAEAAGAKVAGFVVTPLSARARHMHEVFNGPWREWPDLVFRGMVLAFDREFLPHPDFEFKVPMPLVAIVVGKEENKALPMMFYTDRPRMLKP